MLTEATFSRLEVAHNGKHYWKYNQLMKYKGGYFSEQISLTVCSRFVEATEALALPPPSYLKITLDKITSSTISITICCGI